MKNDFKFDEWLREQLNERKWSTFDMAEKAGVTRACIGYYLLGERSPSLNTLLIILDALGKKLVITDLQEDV